MYQIYGLRLDPHKIDCVDRWVFAGNPFMIGESSKKSKKRILFLLCGFDFLRILASLLISTIHLIFFSIGCKRSRASSDGAPSVVLLGFGAGAEKSIFLRIKKWYRSDNVIEFSSLTKDDYFLFAPRPSFFSILSVMVGFWWRSYRVLAIHKPRYQRIDVRWFIYLSSAAYEYAVWYCWARAAKQKIQKAYVICNDLRSFALVNNDISVEYWQHGFFKKSLVFPDYSCISVMTTSDEEFVTGRVRGAVVRKVPGYDLGNFDDKMGVADLKSFIREDVKEIFIASIYGSNLFYQRVKNLLGYLQECGSYNVTVKVHPSESDSFWNIMSDRYRLQVLRADKDLVGSLRYINPDFFVSWYSTSFLDALNLGIKSLSLCTQAELGKAGLVFNLSQHVNAYDDLFLSSPNKPVLDPVKGKICDFS